MAKLKCKDHGRRVVVFYTRKKGTLTIHRNDGSKCASIYVFIGRMIIAPIGVLSFNSDTYKFWR